jgi:hypothetical protein
MYKDNSNNATPGRKIFTDLKKEFKRARRRFCLTMGLTIWPP